MCLGEVLSETLTSNGTNAESEQLRAASPGLKKSGTPIERQLQSSKVFLD